MEVFDLFDKPDLIFLKKQNIQITFASLIDGYQFLLGLKKYLTINSSSYYRLTFPFLFLSTIWT